MAKAKLTQALILGGTAIQPSDFALGAYAGTAPVNVMAASTGNVTLSALLPASTLDGVTLVLNDKVLIKNQTNAVENGIYIVTASGGQIDPISAQRFTTRDVQIISVYLGTTNQATLWLCSTYNTTFNGTVFSNPLAFYQLSSGGGGGSVNSVTVATGNGFAGTVANPNVNPVITLSTTVNGILKGNGTAVSAAVAADFPILNQNTTGNAATATNINGGTAGQVVYQTGANTTGFIPSVNGAVLVTSVSGTPSFATTLPAVNGAALTNLNASNIATGTITPARLPIATTAQLGAVQPDGITIAIDGAGVISAIGGGGGGTVTDVSVVSANGFAGTVATSTSTPAITLTTSVTGILKGDGTAMSAAVAADFPVLNQNTTGTAALATGVEGGVANNIPYQTAPDTTAFIAPLANAVLASDVSGVPSMVTTLPAVNVTNTQIIDPTTGLLNNLSSTINNVYTQSGAVVAFRSTNANTVMDATTDSVVEVTADNITVDLPSGASCPVGKVFTVQMANNINGTVATQGSDTILGTLTTFNLPNPYYSLAVYWTGSTFVIS